MESKPKVYLDPPNALSPDLMRKMILKAVKSEQALKSDKDVILHCIDPENKAWTPVKVKKAMVDQIQEVICAQP